MSIRQLQTYLGRIKKDDPNRSYFIETIIPSLKSTKDNYNNQKYSCPVCVKGTINDKSVNREKVSFTNYYTYIRHLQEQHYSILPCDGEVFNSEYDPESSIETRTLKRSKDVKHYKCISCEVSFSRKEHYKNHLESKRHKRKEQELNFDQDKKVLNNSTHVINIIKEDDHDIDDDIPSYQISNIDETVIDSQIDEYSSLLVNETNSEIGTLAYQDQSKDQISPRMNIEAFSMKLKEIENNNLNQELKRKRNEDEDEDDMLLIEHLDYFEANYKKHKN